MPTMLLMIALQAASAPPALDATPVATEKKICRREVETGSRIGGTRRRLTKAQWDAEARAHADNLERQRGYARSSN